MLSATCAKALWVNPIFSVFTTSLAISPDYEQKMAYCSIKQVISVFPRNKVDRGPKRLTRLCCLT